MLLEDAKSKAQVESALESGDEELLEDIEEKLGDAARAYNNNLSDYVEAEEIDYNDVVTSNAFVAMVKQESPSDYDLEDVPDDRIRSHLLDAWGWGRYGSETFVVNLHGHFRYDFPSTLDYTFPDHLLPEGYEYIPEKVAEEFWESVPEYADVTWDFTNRIDQNYGTSSGYEDNSIGASEEAFTEFCRDVLSDYIDTLIEGEPKKAVDLFLSNLSPAKATTARENMSTEDLLDFAHRFFVEHDREEVESELDDFLEILKAPKEPNEIIFRVTQDELKSIGVTKGTLYEEAPWTLIKLWPSDLRLEGTRMRHCVGDKSMGYLEAVRDGDIEIWSLRSRNNKPRFTLEVDPSAYPPIIEQLKGKANRTPGFASARSSEVRFPEEIVFWSWLLKQLGVDPITVSDFADTFLSTQKRMTANPRTRRSFNRHFARASF